MSTSADLERAIRSSGLRMTVQRRLILDAVVAVEGHISADAIYQRVAHQFPDVNLSTIYRTLETLESLGLVTHTHFHDGVAFYHLSGNGVHQHLVCLRCGLQTELDLTLLEPLKSSLRQEYGFQADLAHSAIVGICANCAAEERSQPDSTPANA